MGTLTIEFDGADTWTDRERAMLALLLESQRAVLQAALQSAGKAAEMAMRRKETVASAVAAAPPSWEEIARTAFEEVISPLVTKHLPGVRAKLT